MQLRALLAMAFGCACTALTTPAAPTKRQVLGPWWSRAVVLNGPPYVAAAARPPVPAEGAPSIDVSLRSAYQSIQGEFITEAGVDYAAARASQSYRDFTQLTAQLVDVDVAALSVAERTAFFLNLYNALLIHAITSLGPPASLTQRLKLYATAAYQIGPNVLSLNDIENGILRGNRRAAAPFSKPPFAADDAARLALCLPCDARVHFALNCGAKSCPPIRVYDPKDLDAQLDTATRSFVDAETALTGKGALECSKLFDWYAVDFEPTPRRFIDTYLPDGDERAGAEAGKLRYAVYDWGLNSS